MPVIFLDIDGVLNRKRQHGGGKHRTVDSDLLDRFYRLVRDTGARVVLSSTWRHDVAGLTAAREQGVPFDDVLPDLRPRSRAEEIEQWLRAHPGAGRFAAIDDDDDGYGSIPLFQPDPSEGLTRELTAANVRDALVGHRG